jgi:multicomponent Na+:H+ antiporter subunit G
MNVRETIAAVLLGLSVLVELMSAVGLLVMRNPFDRLHYLAPATTIGPIALAAAMLIAESDAQAKIKSALVAVVLLATGPILTHATARAAWTRMQARDNIPDADKGEEA